MALSDWNLWHWLAVVQHELLLFAGVFFLIGALDDFAIDVSWLWLRWKRRIRTLRIRRRHYQQRSLKGPTAIFIPTWQEEAVIADTIAHLLGAWPQDELRLYIGIYRNDPKTLEAAMGAANGDSRLRLVIHNCAGPSTKADCLNRLFKAMRDDERRHGKPYTMTVFHDAEDLVDPAALGLLDEAICDGADFVQLPVEPLPQNGRNWLGSHYCEEFAEAHGKAMMVRDAMGAALPAAGVGCAISRKALQRLCRRRIDMCPFEPESLTEDYELGLAIAEEGGLCRFVRARGEDDLLVATRAYFPSRIDSIVRQKTRWVHGIALQGWDRTGWGEGSVETWMRARDRRGPLTALVLLLGYTLLGLTLLMWFALSAGLFEARPMEPLLVALFYTNVGFFAWRCIWRFAFTARNYGVMEGVFSVLRIPATNVVAIMAGRRALMSYWRNLTGRRIEWDKTPHTDHPARFGEEESIVRKAQLIGL